MIVCLPGNGSCLIQPTIVRSAAVTNPYAVGL